MNEFNDSCPEIPPPSVTASAAAPGWPPVAGEYHVLAHATDCPLAVITLASPSLADALAARRPNGVSIIGKLETENIGIEKLILNVLASPHIRTVLVCGRESAGHFSGASLVALASSGVDGAMRIIGSPGRRPVLANTAPAEIEAFRGRIRVVDMIGCEDIEAIGAKLDELRAAQTTRSVAELPPAPPRRAAVEAVQARATAPDRITLDRAGYFVIITRPEAKVIAVEHYDYDNRLLRVIEGPDARSLCHTITAAGWVTELSHATYLGRELARAEQSLRSGLRYVQDGA